MISTKQNDQETLRGLNEMCNVIASGQFDMNKCTVVNRKTGVCYSPVLFSISINDMLKRMDAKSAAIIEDERKEFERALKQAMDEDDAFANLRRCDKMREDLYRMSVATWHVKIAASFFVVGVVCLWIIGMLAKR